MKRHNSLFLFTFCALVMASCADTGSDSADDGSCDEATYIRSCNEALNAVRQCIGGKVQEVACMAGQTCNTVSNSCEAAVAVKCDGTYVRTCNAAFTGYTVCEGGKIVERLCSGGQTCQAETALCESPGVQTPEQPAAACTAESYQRKCNANFTGYTVCESGNIVEKACPTGQYCDANSVICGSKAQCDETYTRQCNSDFSGYTVCESGMIIAKTCPSGQSCNASTVLCESPSQGPSCNEATYERKCKEDLSGFVNCVGGKEQEYSCPNGQTCDMESVTCKSPISGAECDASSYPDSCPTPHEYRHCVSGRIVTETCKGGTVCNEAIKTKSCKTPNPGDKCNPETFAESCYGATVALICDESNKVTKFDCSLEKNGYGKDFKCDVASDFYGKGLDVAMCYSNGDKCKTPGDVESECKYDEERDIHVTTKYECLQFNTGEYWYVAEQKDCESGGQKFNCNTNKTDCKE